MNSPFQDLSLFRNSHVQTLSVARLQHHLLLSPEHGQRGALTTEAGTYTLFLAQSHCTRVGLGGGWDGLHCPFTSILVFSAVLVEYIGCWVQNSAKRKRIPCCFFKKNNTRVFKLPLCVEKDKQGNRTTIFNARICMSKLFWQRKWFEELQNVWVVQNGALLPELWLCI